VQFRVSFARRLFSQLFEQDRGSSPDGTKAHEGRAARSSAPQIVRAWAWERSAKGQIYLEFWGSCGTRGQDLCCSSRASPDDV